MGEDHLQVVKRLLKAMEDCDGYGYDPYDTRVGPVYQWLFDRRQANSLANLAIKGLYALDLASPVLYRRLRGIPQTWDPMGNSYRAGAHLALSTIEATEEHRQAARTILDRVVACAVGDPGRRGFALGFPCITGSYKLWPTDIPVSHYTLRVVRVLLRYERTVRDGRYLPAIEEGIRFLTEGLPWVERDGTLGVGYSPADPLQVLNIWADVASVLASHAKLTGNEQNLERSQRLIEGVIGHQMTDGAWPYFARWERPPGQVDNSHTAMVLGALADVAICLGGPISVSVRNALLKGIPRWIELFFDEESGRHWNEPGSHRQSNTVSFGDALYCLIRANRTELSLPGPLRSRMSLLSETITSWSMANLRMRSGRFCERRIGPWKHSVLSVRSFDGLIADSMALHRAFLSGQSQLIWSI